jgi:hypothetical protein
MMTITQDQARKRYTLLPSSLQDAIFSVQIAEIVSDVAEANNLDDDRSYKLSEIVGWTLLGFVHPEDLGKELQDEASVPPQTAESVSNALNAKVFASIKADLDKAYAPVPHGEGVDSPKIFQDISPAPAIIALSPTRPATLAPMPRPMMTPPPPKPPLPSAGWSRSTEQPVVKLSQTSVPPPQNTGAPKVTQPAPRPAAIPINGPVGEFERRAIQTGEKKVTMPGPVMLHEDTSFKPAQQPPNFHLQLPNQEIDAMKSASQQPPMRAAFLELGKPQTPPPAPGSMSTPRVVHYSEYKSPSPEAPITPASSAPRRVTELTAAPKPPTPPAATPPIPTPPNKVIYKDYGAPPSPPRP